MKKDASADGGSMQQQDSSKEKYDHWFNREHLKSKLRKQSVKGGVSTVGSQGVTSVITTLSTIVMARLLMPEDFGLVAMVTAVSGFVLIFNDLGLGHAVVQREVITQKEVSQVYWINIAISLTVAVIIAALSPLMVYFYNEPRLLNIGLAYAGMAVFGGLSIQHTALMRRQMKLQRLATIRIWVSTISVLVGIVMALLGMGYWALVGSAYAITMGNTAFKWYYCDWRPDWVRIDKGVREYVNFGANISGFNLINYFSRNLDNVLIGRYVGSVTLGLYTKAYSLLMLPISKLRDPLNGVVIPALSSLLNEPERFKNYYGKYLFMLSFFAMPLIVFLGICAYPIIYIVLGEQWLEATDYFQLLAIAGFIQPSSSTVGVVLIAMGQTRRFLMIGIGSTVVTIISFVVGIQWGVYGILIGFIVSNYIILLPLLWYSFKHTPIGMKHFFNQIFYPLIFSVIAGGISFIVYHYSGLDNLFVLLALSILVFATSYIALWHIAPATRMRFAEVKSVGGSILNSAIRKIYPSRSRKK